MSRFPWIDIDAGRPGSSTHSCSVRLPALVPWSRRAGSLEMPRTVCLLGQRQYTLPLQATLQT